MRAMRSLKAALAIKHGLCLNLGKVPWREDDLNQPPRHCPFHRVRKLLRATPKISPNNIFLTRLITGADVCAGNRSRRATAIFPCHPRL
jgi:hypothetical protein